MIRLKYPKSFLENRRTLNLRAPTDSLVFFSRFNLRRAFILAFMHGLSFVLEVKETYHCTVLPPKSEERACKWKNGYLF